MSADPLENSITESGQYDSLAAKVSGRLADVALLPDPARAIFGYHSTSGQLAVDVIRIQRSAERFIEDTISTAFSEIEREIAGEYDLQKDTVSFDYKTKLTMPAELTLGHIYRQAIQNSPKNFNPVTQKVSSSVESYFRVPFDKDAETKRRKRLMNKSSDQLDRVELAEDVTELVVVALLDGDMRDAINDEEYNDFEITPVAKFDKQQVAAIAQETLQTKVEGLFDGFNTHVRAAYDEAVEISENHQKDDPYFRELMATAKTGDEEALEAIQDEYKYGSFDGVEFNGEIIDPQTLFGEDQTFPYLKTQYGRVGVIYDGMIEMYRHAGIEIEGLFKQSIVFAIIGAQIWLDDIDDYHADLAETQLTPVTAEYLLAETEREAYRNIEQISKQYLLTAKQHAAQIDSPLAGIGTDYIYRLGNPSILKNT